MTTLLKNSSNNGYLENWEESTQNELTGLRQHPTDLFKIWLVKAATLNAILAGTPSHKKEAAFRPHVEGCICKRLSQMVIDNQTSEIVGYKAWQDALILHAKKDLHSAHASCFKCRKFYAGHLRKNYPDDPPKADGYRALTTADAAKAKASKENKPSWRPKGTTAAVSTLNNPNFDAELPDDVAAMIKNTVTDGMVEGDVGSECVGAETRCMCRVRLIREVRDKR